MAITHGVPKAAEAARGSLIAQPGTTATTVPPIAAIAVTPTQIRRPRRTTIRTVFQALVALCAMAPILVTTTGLKGEQLPWLAGVLAVAAAVTRVMALPQVELFLRRFAPWLAAAPKPKD